MDQLDAQAIGGRVRARREALKWSQRQLDGKAEVGHGYISKLEKGEVNPTLVTLGKIAAALNLRVEDLLGEQPNRLIDTPVEYEARQPGDETQRRIDVNLLRLRELRPTDLETVDHIVLAMTEQAERAYQEELRVRRAERRAAEQTRQVDPEEESPQPD